MSYVSDLESMYAHTPDINDAREATVQVLENQIYEKIQKAYLEGKEFLVIPFRKDNISSYVDLLKKAFKQEGYEVDKLKRFGNTYLFITWSIEELVNSEENSLDIKQTAEHIIFHEINAAIQDSIEKGKNSINIKFTNLEDIEILRTVATYYFEKNYVFPTEYFRITKEENPSKELKLIW